MKLVPTASQTVGPFFHSALPYPRGHELVPPARQGAVRLHGVVYDGNGTPVPDALLELRQADDDGLVPTAEGSLRRDGTVFTGWGRCATDPAGHYSFTTLEPGPTRKDRAPFFALTVFARGLLDRLFTRAYLPTVPAGSDPFLQGLDESVRRSLMVAREPAGSLRFDVHLQGDRQTAFLSFPRHRET